ncbi:MAG: alanine--tRNA ligase [Candidatus Dormibacteria bacterium]
MRSPEIRERFLHFFEARGHHRLPSASLIPHDDPSILFNVAGMVPLKPYFLGIRTPPTPRATSCQKCFRTVDIEEVGRTPRHDTFFEMLGNFSFGDYFKETAIPLAWELLTREYGLPAERLWPTVHPEDAVARRLWTDTIGVPPDRVGGLEENFWPGGGAVPGPCGYDSEIHWDRQVDCSCRRQDCRPGCDGDRWVEIWNLVFMEFDRDSAERLNPLPRPSIDTGMGMERITAVLQDAPSIFETDLFAPLVAGIEARSEDGPPGLERTVSLRICADHLRAAAFLLGDGVQPGPDKRGYVVRWLVRRAGIHGRRLGLRDGLAGGIDDVIATMGPAYPELAEARERITRTLRVEEEAFAATLEAGARRLEQLLAGGSHGISGDDAFLLHDTFGFPIELTTEMASERGAVVDLAGFEAAMNAQRRRSRPAAPAALFTVDAALPETSFVGYDTLQTRSTVVHVSASQGPPAEGDPSRACAPGPAKTDAEGSMAQGVPDEGDDSLQAAGEGMVLLDPSPFYAEAGGQIGDTGTLSWDGGRAAVLDTVHVPPGKARSHRVRVEQGRLIAGMEVVATVDEERRKRIARHHSATHLLHRTLRDVLGEHAVQHGSFVGPDHTTFDFSFDRGLTEEELREVEHRVNEAIRGNIGREIELLPIAEARASGAVALFGEKYGDTVRVVDFGGWARELCGGTHVHRSGDIGAAMVVSETSIGRGLRRIEMVAGEAAEQRWRTTGAALRQAARALRARPDEVPARVETLISQQRRLSRELEHARRSGDASPVAAALVEAVGGFRLAHLILEGEAAGLDVTEVTDRIFAERLGADGVAVVLGGRSMAVKVGGSALAAGLSAGDLVRAGSQQTGAAGGGRPGFARGGVGDPARRREALAAIRTRLARDQS